MTRNFTYLLLACCLLALPVFFGACVRDGCEQSKTFRLYTPVTKKQAEVRNLIASSAPQPVERPGKIYLMGNYIFLNDIDRGIHVIDNTDPSSPKNVSWIPIPGNMDMAAKGNYLYIDFYRELVTLDISDPLNVHVAGFKKDVFPARSYNNNQQWVRDGEIIYDWTSKDTVINRICEQENTNPVFADYAFATEVTPLGGLASSVSSPYGLGGSMARFTITGNWLYTVSISALGSIDLANPADPVLRNLVQLGYGAETIFPFRNELFIGSQTGMYRFDLATPGEPKQIGTFSHMRACDPVVADEHNAFVTLRSGNTCAGYTNQLDIISLDQPSANDPFRLLVSHPMTNPHGLGKDGDLLFICDGTAGLKIFDSKDIYHLSSIATFPMEASDVILYNKRALVIAKEGMYQFDYSDRNNVRQLSKINIEKL